MPASSRQDSDIPDFSMLSESTESADAPEESTEESPVESNEEQPWNFTEAVSDAPGATFVPGDNAEESVPAITEPPVAEPANLPETVTTDPPPATTVPAYGRGKQKQKLPLFFWILLSYAFALTLGCAWLCWQVYLSNPHTLESLPDLAPPKKATKIRMIPENASMPPGHTLELGDEQRFGNLRVKPVKITEEPLKAGAKGKPVLKLWLELENVSDSQAFAPFDYKLLTNRILDESPNPKTDFRANQFLAKVDQKSREGERLLLYDFSPAELKTRKDLHGSRELMPGKKKLGALVSEEPIFNLKGDLVWRVHFRKGHNPKSGRGVTTLIEVKFNSDDIQRKS